MDFLFLEEVDSTNKYAKENFAKLDDFTIIYTNNQTAGRGRLERKWENIGEDNIYASILIKPNCEISNVFSNLTQYLCLILAETFEEYGVKPQIKWPNDIRINKKKISGILAESVVTGNKLDALILGFGVNLNCKEDVIKNINQPATSLNIEIGMEIDKKTFLKKVADKFCLRYNEFIKEGFLLIREDYIRRAEFLDAPVTVKVFDKKISGLAKNITKDGALEIVDGNNKKHVLLIGDIL